MKLCSACLLGVKCRYDGNSMSHEKIINLASTEVLIPICPEQMGWLPTPRESVELKNGQVVTKNGKNLTDQYMYGANQVLALAKLYNIKSVILKQGSPSCGCGKIYDGTFSGAIINGDGITTRLLKENGIAVLTENDL